MFQSVSYPGNTIVFEQRVRWLPTKTRSLDIALVACQGYFFHWCFPIPLQCNTVQATAYVHLSVFLSLVSFQIIQDLTVIWRPDLLPKWLQEMLERVTLAGILPTQDSFSMKAPGSAARDR